MMIVEHDHLLFFKYKSGLFFFLLSKMEDPEEHSVFNTIHLIKLTKNSIYETEYENAKNSYDTIYNNIMSTGKNFLKSHSLMGKTINLTIDSGDTFQTHEYYASVKADGRRFLMMLADVMDEETDEDHLHTAKGSSRHVYFVDMDNEFWMLLYNKKKLIQFENTGNLLLDGELLLLGDVKYDAERSMYTIQKDHDHGSINEPFVVFLAFDILYGPIALEHIDQRIQYTGHAQKSFKENIKFGNVVPYIGFKKSENWPTKARRSILEQIINNKLSVIDKYNVESYLSRNFIVSVNHFYKLDKLLLKDPETNYLYTSLRNKYIDHLYFEISQKYLYKYANADQINHIRLSKDIIKTDGLIFTPIHSPYIIGNWSYCSFKLFKWKPEAEFTIDVEIGPRTNGPDYEHLAYDNKRKPIIYDGKKLLINNFDEFPEGTIVECSVNKDLSSLSIKRPREDKTKGNAYRTIIDIINNIFMDPDKLLVLLCSVRRIRISNLSESKQIVLYRQLYQEYKELFNFLSIRKRFQLFFLKEPYRLFSGTLGPLLDTFTNKREQLYSKQYEIEGQIIFNRDKRLYSPYIICMLQKIPETTEIIKIYNKDNRYELFKFPKTDNYIISSMMIKREIRSTSNNYIPILFDNIKDCKTNISSEKNLPINIDAKELFKELKEVSATYNVQKRYVTQNILGHFSHHWKLEIIEYGSSKNSVEEARERLARGQVRFVRTHSKDDRLQTEAPILEYEDPVSIEEWQSKITNWISNHNVAQNLQSYIKEKLINHWKSERILKNVAILSNEEITSCLEKLKTVYGSNYRFELEFDPGYNIKQLYDLYNVEENEHKKNSIKEELIKEIKQFLKIEVSDNYEQTHNEISSKESEAHLKDIEASELLRNVNIKENIKRKYLQEQAFLLKKEGITLDTLREEARKLKEEGDIVREMSSKIFEEARILRKERDLAKNTLKDETSLNDIDNLMKLYDKQLWNYDPYRVTYEYCELMYKILYHFQN